MQRVLSASLASLATIYSYGYDIGCRYDIGSRVSVWNDNDQDLQLSVGDEVITDLADC